MMGQSGTCWKRPGGTPGGRRTSTWSCALMGTVGDNPHLRRESPYLENDTVFAVKPSLDLHASGRASR